MAWPWEGEFWCDAVPVDPQTPMGAGWDAAVADDHGRYWFFRGARVLPAQTVVDEPVDCAWREDLTLAVLAGDRPYLRWGAWERLSQVIPGLDWPRVDAAVAVDASHAYLFFQEQCVCIDLATMTLREGYPCATGEQWFGLGDEPLNAALLIDGGIAFIRGHRLIRFDLEDQRVSSRALDVPELEKFVDTKILCAAVHAGTPGEMLLFQPADVRPVLVRTPKARTIFERRLRMVQGMQGAVQNGAFERLIHAGGQTTAMDSEEMRREMERVFRFALSPENGGETYEDIIIHFQTWDGSNWTARLVGTTFRQTAQGSAVSHDSDTLRYQTWDDSNWSLTFEDGKLVKKPESPTSSPAEQVRQEDRFRFQGWDGKNWLGVVQAPRDPMAKVREQIARCTEAREQAIKHANTLAAEAAEAAEAAQAAAAAARVAEERARVTQVDALAAGEQARAAVKALEKVVEHAQDVRQQAASAEASFHVAAGERVVQDVLFDYKAWNGTNHRAHIVDGKFLISIQGSKDIVSTGELQFQGWNREPCCVALVQGQLRLTLGPDHEPGWLHYRCWDGRHGRAQMVTQTSIEELEVPTVAAPEVPLAKFTLFSAKENYLPPEAEPEPVASGLEGDSETETETDASEAPVMFYDDGDEDPQAVDDEIESHQDAGPPDQSSEGQGSDDNQVASEADPSAASTDEPAAGEAVEAEVSSEPGVDTPVSVEPEISEAEGSQEEPGEAAPQEATDEPGAEVATDAVSVDASQPETDDVATDAEQLAPSPSDASAGETDAEQPTPAEPSLAVESEPAVDEAVEGEPASGEGEPSVDDSDDGEGPDSSFEASAEVVATQDVEPETQAPAAPTPGDTEDGAGADDEVDEPVTASDDRAPEEHSGGGADASAEESEKIVDADEAAVDDSPQPQGQGESATTAGEEPEDVVESNAGTTDEVESDAKDNEAIRRDGEAGDDEQESTEATGDQAPEAPETATEGSVDLDVATPDSPQDEDAKPKSRTSEESVSSEAETSEDENSAQAGSADPRAESGDSPPSPQPQPELALESPVADEVLEAPERSAEDSNESAATPAASVVEEKSVESETPPAREAQEDAPATSVEDVQAPSEASAGEPETAGDGGEAETSDSPAEESVGEPETPDSDQDPAPQTDEEASSPANVEQAVAAPEPTSEAVAAADSSTGQETGEGNDATIAPADSDTEASTPVASAASPDDAAAENEVGKEPGAAVPEKSPPAPPSQSPDRKRPILPGRRPPSRPESTSGSKGLSAMSSRTSDSGRTKLSSLRSMSNRSSLSSLSSREPAPKPDDPPGTKPKAAGLSRLESLRRGSTSSIRDRLTGKSTETKPAPAATVAAPSTTTGPKTNDSAIESSETPSATPVPEEAATVVVETLEVDVDVEATKVVAASKPEVSGLMSVPGAAIYDDDDDDDDEFAVEISDDERTRVQAVPTEPPARASSAAQLAVTDDDDDGEADFDLDFEIKDEPTVVAKVVEEEDFELDFELSDGEMIEGPATRPPSKPEPSASRVSGVAVAEEIDDDEFDLDLDLDGDVSPEPAPKPRSPTASYGAMPPTPRGLPRRPPPIAKRPESSLAARDAQTLRYRDWDGNNCLASIDGEQFIQSNSEHEAGKAIRALHYKSWDGSNWIARVVEGKFVRMAQRGGPEIADRSLRYKNWSGANATIRLKARR